MVLVRRAVFVAARPLGRSNNDLGRRVAGCVFMNQRRVPSAAPPGVSPTANQLIYAVVCRSATTLPATGYEMIGKRDLF